MPKKFEFWRQFESVSGLRLPVPGVLVVALIGLLGADHVILVVLVYATWAEGVV